MTMTQVTLNQTPYIISLTVLFPYMNNILTKRLAFLFRTVRNFSSSSPLSRKLEFILDMTFFFFFDFFWLQKKIEMKISNLLI